MITVYKKKSIPYKDIVATNDIFFNKVTSSKLDERAKEIIASIDKTKMVDKYAIKSRFDGKELNIDKLSTGCKTALNIMYNKEKVFDVSECGENALKLIYNLHEGNIYCTYPMISFDMKRVYAYDGKNKIEIDDYDELRKWWNDED